jgi:transposase
MSTKRTVQKVIGNQKLLQIGNEQSIKLDGTKSIEEQIKNLNFDTQIKAKEQRAPKRKFSNAYKLQILNALDACKQGEERAALLRKEGLYYARISLWRKQFQNGKFTSNKAPKSILLTQQLSREVASLKKKLSQAEAIIDLQKKVSELLSINILDHDMSET